MNEKALVFAILAVMGITVVCLLVAVLMKLFIVTFGPTAFVLCLGAVGVVYVFYCMFAG